MVPRPRNWPPEAGMPCPYSPRTGRAAHTETPGTPKDRDHARVPRHALTEPAQTGDRGRHVEPGQAYLPVDRGLPDRHVMVSDHRRVDPDLDPRHHGMDSVTGHEGSSVHVIVRRPRHPLRHRPSERRDPARLSMGGRTLVADHVNHDEATPDLNHPEPSQQQLRPAEPTLVRDPVPTRTGRPASRNPARPPIP